MPVNAELRRHCEQYLFSLRQDRYSWWLHWTELAKFILPRRMKWLVTPNQYRRGGPINDAIFDSTGTLAARTLASGMMNITSPTRPWFELSIDGFAVDEDSNPVTLWLEEVRRRMMRVMQESNFYNAMGVMFLDLAVFGTGCSIIYEDFEDVIRCFNPCAGEYYLANSDRFAVDTLGREFVLTARQLAQQFGEANLSESARSLLRSATPASLNTEIRVGHLIEPDPSKRFAWRETYWEVGAAGDLVLAERGFLEWPALCPRWDIVSNEAYGRGPGMDALPDIKQLQQETKRKGQAIDKMVNPPLVADIQLKNQPASLLPGGVTYVQGLASGGVGMKPIFTVLPPINEMKEDIAEIQQRIKDTFFNPLFLMISQLETVRTATEIDARREEQLTLLGPVLERFQNEALDPAIDRIFGIMSRARLLPPPPKEIAGQPIQINYVSMLAEAQNAVQTGGIERWLQLLGNLSAVDPEIMDNADLDETAQGYARLLKVSPRFVRSDAAIVEIRKARQAAKEQAALLQQTSAAVAGAKTLSETDVGGGENALQAMLN